MTSVLKREMDRRGIPERELRKLPDYSHATKNYRGKRPISPAYALHYCRLFGIDPRLLCPDLPWEALKDIPLSAPPATTTNGVFSMTKKNAKPTTFVFPDGEKPVISSNALGLVYPGVRENAHGNLLVKIRAGIASLLSTSPDFVASNVHIVLSPRNTHRQREILMTEDGARAILKEIRGRAPKAMADFVEAALDIVDERFSQAPAPTETPSRASALDEALARNVALSSRAAELEREIDDLRDQIAQLEGQREEDDATKARQGEEIFSLKGIIKDLEAQSRRENEEATESKTTRPEKVCEADALAETFRAAGMDAVDSVCAAAEFVYGRSNVAQYWAKRDSRRRRDAELAAAEAAAME